MTPQARYQQRVRLDPAVRQREAEYQRQHRAIPAVKEQLAKYHRHYRRTHKTQLRAADRVRKERKREIARQEDLVRRGLLRQVRVYGVPVSG